MNAKQRHLVKRFRSGDTAAENELFERYKTPILWKISRHIQSDKEEIKDIAGEVFLAITEGLRKADFQAERWESLEAFIWGVTHNKIRDWFKRQKKEIRVFHSDPPSEQVSAAVEQFSLETGEIYNILKALLNELEAPYREALCLRFLQELSVKEISEQTGLPARRVSERIHYALKLMRKACRKKNFPSILAGLFLLLTCYAGIFYEE